MDDKKKSSSSFSSFRTEENEMLKYGFCRIVFRSSVTNLMSDINGLDLYTNSVLGVDRYQVAEKLFKFLKNHLSLN